MKRGVTIIKEIDGTYLVRYNRKYHLMDDVIVSEIQKSFILSEGLTEKFIGNYYINGNALPANYLIKFSRYSKIEKDNISYISYCIGDKLALMEFLNSYR